MASAAWVATPASHAPACLGTLEFADMLQSMQPTAPVHPGDVVTPAEWRVFWSRLLQAAGLGSLGAGVIFFVAANWQAWGLAGRFGLLEAGLLACVAASLKWPPPARVGQGALLLATLFTGALLALFGQSYQTGADTWELFLAWALLALPFAVAALSGAAWALWFCVLDVGLALLCGQRSPGRMAWILIDDWRREPVVMLMLSCVANLAGAAASAAIRRTRLADAAPRWLTQALLAVGLGFGTVASLPGTSDHAAAAFGSYAVIWAGIGIAAWSRWRDVFPLTVLAGSFIVLSSAWLGHAMNWHDFGSSLFVLALWLIGSSTAAGALLMRWLRQWRAAADVGRAS